MISPLSLDEFCDQVENYLRDTLKWPALEVERFVWLRKSRLFHEHNCGASVRAAAMALLSMSDAEVDSSLIAERAALDRALNRPRVRGGELCLD
jgi:hypothetical protein